MKLSVTLEDKTLNENTDRHNVKYTDQQSKEVINNDIIVLAIRDYSTSSYRLHVCLYRFDHPVYVEKDCLW